MTKKHNNVLWQKNLFNSRYDVEQASDVHSEKSTFDRLADMTELTHKKRNSFPWLVLALGLSLIAFYSYDGNIVTGQNATPLLSLDVHVAEVKEMKKGMKMNKVTSLPPLQSVNVMNGQSLNHGQLIASLE